MYVPVSMRLTVYSIPRRSRFAMNSLSVMFCDLRKMSPRRFSTRSPPPCSTGGLEEGAKCGCSPSSFGGKKSCERKLADSAHHHVEQLHENRNLRTGEHEGPKL